MPLCHKDTNNTLVLLVTPYKKILNLRTQALDLILAALPERFLR